MTWSFNPALTTDKDVVRFLVSDTDVREQLVSDEGIALMLVEHRNRYLAAAACADIIAGTFASEESFSVKGIVISDGKSRGDQYRALAQKLRIQAQTASISGPGGSTGAGPLGGAPFVGGASTGDAEPVFRVGQHDFN